jgi:hypothetical protein
MRQADDGDMEARAVITSLKDYFAMASKGAANGVFPSCVGCGIELHRGEMSAYGVLLPVGDEGVGLVAAFCYDCACEGCDAARRKFVESLQNDTGIEVGHVH